MMDAARLRAILGRFGQLHLLVVGDYFLDNYLLIDPALSETSLETGLEAYQVVGTRPCPGAAGTVTNNLRALGVGVTALSVLGDDGAGYELRRGLAATGVDTSALVTAPGRLTPTYTKPTLRQPDGSERELNRLDFKNRTPLPQEIERQVIVRLRELAGQADGIIVADQVNEPECGVITSAVREALAHLGAERPGLVITADSRERVDLFREVIVVPNVREALSAVLGGWRGEPSRHEAEKAGEKLCARNGRPVFVTVGAGGMLVFTRSGMAHVPGVPVSGPIDIVGAGDSAMAGLTSALCAGAAPEEAALVANLAASVTVQQIGTTGTATQAQILHAFRTWKKPGKT
jgi:rfaE bifunctional protein kinase chain/domain